MKKIISMVLALTTVFSSFAAIVKANELPTVTVETTKIDDTDEIDEIVNALIENGDIEEAEEVADYGLYKIEAYLEGLELSRDSQTKINGTMLSAFELMANGDMTKFGYYYIDGTNYPYLSLSDGPTGFTLGWDATKFKNTKSFPAKNQTLDTEEPTLFYAAYIFVEDGTSFTVAGASLGTYSYSAGSPTGTQTVYDEINYPTTVVFGSSAPATVDVTSVTISGATAATVGDDVQLSATVLPDNATDKTVTWTKVSGNGAVSDSGVVTATEAGDVVVKATAGGVDSANYTVSFAAPAPTPVYTDSSIDVKKPVSGTTGLTDLQGKDVTLTANYGIAKFSKAIDTVANKYFVVATDSEDVEKEFEVDFAANGVEISNASTTFFAIVKSADHIIKSIRLKEIAK